MAAGKENAGLGSAFVKLKCPGCGNEQIAFSKASTKIRCLVCNKELAETGASKIKPKTKEIRELK